jgi:hypothetical protein
VGNRYHLEDLRIGENNIKMDPGELEWFSLSWCELDLSHAALTSVELC